MITQTADQLVDYLARHAKVMVLAFFTYAALC